MGDIRTFNVAYDASSDVLYISSRSAQAVRGVEDSLGIVWRYAGDGALISATVMDFQELWSGCPGKLAKELSKQFRVPSHHALTVVEHALRSH